MLLIDSWNCKIDDKCDENEKINNAINRNKRENVVDDFDFEIISIYDIDFIDVEIDVMNEKNDVIVVIVITNADENEIDEINEIIIENFFACFVRTCSWSLMLLTNFSKHRLQTNVFVFFFVIRAFSILMFSSNKFINWL